MNRVLAVLAVALMLAGSVAFRPHDAELKERLDVVDRRNLQVEIAASYFTSPKLFGVGTGRTFNISAADVVVRGDNRGLRQFVEVTDSAGRMIFRDYHVIWNRPPLAVWVGRNIVEDVELAITTTHTQMVYAMTDGWRVPWLPANPGTISTFYSETSDGRIYSYDTTSWATVQNGANFNVDTTATNLDIGMAADLFNTIERLIAVSYFSFDTSAIPDTDEIDDAIFTLFSNGGGDVDATGTLEARAFDWGETLDSADWIDFIPATNWTDLTLLATLGGGSWVIGTAAENAFVSTAAFPGAINVTGDTRLAVTFAEATGSEPTVDRTKGINYGEFSGTANDPRLLVAHEAAGGGPTPTPTPAPTCVAPDCTRVQFETFWTWLVLLIASVLFAELVPKMRPAYLLSIVLMALLVIEVDRGVFYVIGGLAAVLFAWRGFSEFLDREDD